MAGTELGEELFGSPPPESKAPDLGEELFGAPPPKPVAKKDTAANPMAAKPKPVEGGYGLMGEYIEPDITPVKSDIGIMEGVKPGPADKTGFLPIRPEVRNALIAQYEAASPAQRTQMEMQLPGVAGDVIREHAGKFKERQEKRKTELEKGTRAGLVIPGLFEKFDPSVEARTTRLIGEGEKPEFARVAAEEAAAADVPAGGEIAFTQRQGVVEPTKFDFELFEKYRNASPIIRGGLSGYEGYKRGALGVNEAVADLFGFDEFARTQAAGAEESRNVIASMGQNPNYLARQFEGAIGSISQQLPALFGGAISGSEAYVLGSMFLQSFGQEYSEGKSRKLDPQEATTRAGLFATFEVLGERFGLKFQLDNIRRAASGMKTDELKDFLANTLKKEIPGEYFTTTGQFLTDKSAIGLNKDATFNDYLQQMADTTVQTVMQSGLMAGGTKALGAVVGPKPSTTTETGEVIPTAEQLMREKGFLAGTTKPTATKETPLETEAAEKVERGGAPTPAKPQRIEPTLAEVPPEQRAQIRQAQVEKIAIDIAERTGIDVGDAMRIAEKRVQAEEETEANALSGQKGVTYAGAPITEAGGASAELPVPAVGIPTGVPTGGVAEAVPAGLAPVGATPRVPTEGETVQPSALELTPVQQLASQWDRSNRTSRNQEWMGGAAEANPAFNAVEQEGASVPAHGMAKAATLGQAVNDLVSLLTGGIDATRTLYYDSLTNPHAGVGAGTGTAGGVAYRDGPFIITFREGLTGQPTSDDITGVLVNPANAELVEPLQQMFPNLTIRGYDDVADVVSASLTTPQEEPSVAETPEAIEAEAQREEELGEAPPARKRGRPALAPEQRTVSEQRRQQQRDAYKAVDRQVTQAERMLAEAAEPIDEAGAKDDEQLQEMKENKRTQRNAAIRTLYDISKTNRGKPGQRALALLNQNASTIDIKNAAEGHELRKQRGLIATLSGPSKTVEQAAAQTKPDEKLGKVTNGAQALTQIIKTGNAFQKLLAKRLRGFVANVKIVVVEANQPIPDGIAKNPRYAKDWDRARAMYTENYKTGERVVYVRGASFGEAQGVNNITMLHELLHAALNRKIAIARNEIEAGKRTELTRLLSDLVEIMNNASEKFNDLAAQNKLPPHISKLAEFGEIFDDPREFIAYGMSDPAFQDFLKTARGFGTAQPFYTEFVNAVRRFFGMDDLDTNALADLIDVTNSILSAKAPKAAAADLLSTPSLAADETQPAEPSQYLSVEPPTDTHRKPSFRTEVARVIKAFNEDRISADDAMARVDTVYDETKSQREAKPRKRGALWIRQKLLAAVEGGVLPEKALDFAEWLIKTNPALVEDLAIAVRTAGENNIASGQYNPYGRVFTLFKNLASETTAVHEMLHHMERMMPEAVQDEIRKLWAKRLIAENKKAQSGADADLKEFFNILTNYHFGGAQSELRFRAALEMIADGRVAPENYQYANPSEFWAVNATGIMSKRFDAREGIINKLRQWLREFAERVKDAFGLTSDAPIIKALNSLLKGDGEFQSDMMLGGGSLMSVEKPQSEEPEDIEEQQNAVRTEKQLEAIGADTLEQVRISMDAEELAQQSKLLQALRDPREILPAMRQLWKGATYAQRQFLVNMPTTEFLARWGGSYIPELMNTNVLLEKMGGLTQQLLNSSAILAQTVHKAFKADKTLPKKLAQLVYASTLARVDPSNPNAKERIKEFDRLYAALGAKGQQLYKLVLEYHQDISDYISQVLDDQIANANLTTEAKNQIMALIRKTYETKNKITPYVALIRRGDYWLGIGKGKDRQFYMRETASERDKIAEDYAKKRGVPLRQLVEDGEISVGNDMKSLRDKSFNASGILKSLFDIIDNQDYADPGVKEELKDAMYQLYLTSMPEQSFRNQFIKRKDVTGFSTDLLRNISTTGVKISTQIPRLKYAPLLRNSISAAQDSIVGREELQPFVTEMEARVNARLNPPARSGWATVGDFANRMSYIWYMSGASSALLQPLGIFQTATPILLSRYGQINGARELAKTLKFWNTYGVWRKNPDDTLSFVAPSMANAKGLKDDEKRAIREALGRDAFQATYASSLYGYKSTPTTSLGGPVEITKKGINLAVAGLMHTTERLSREMVFLASYRLNRQAGKGFEEAVNQAVIDTNDALGNYGQYNRPLFMQKGLGKVALQFTMYPLHVTLFLLRNFKNMLPLLNKEGKWEATKIFFGTLGTTWVLTGAQGLPLQSIISTVMGMLSWFWKDEDKPEELKDVDFETWWRAVWLPETIGHITVGGRKLSDIVEYGAANALTGLDIASRTSLNDLWLRDTKETKTARDSVVALAIEKAGPSANLILSFADAIEAFGNGDYQKGVEKISPAIIRNLVLTHKYAEEGAKDFKGGDQLLAGGLTNGEIIGQLVGFRPALLSETQQLAFKLNTIRNQLENERTKLMNNAAREYFNGTRTGEWDKYLKQLDKIEKFNTKHPEFGIDEDQLGESIERREEAMAKSEEWSGMPIDEKLAPYGAEAALNKIERIEQRNRETLQRREQEALGKELFDE